MFGLFLIFIATLFGEIGTSIGKRKVTDRQESIYTMGFLNFLWGFCFILALAFFIPKDFFAPGFPGGFVFTAASLPTFIPRLVLEIAQLHIALLAITRADRSTFGFLRIITIPLLLGVDVILGYAIDIKEMIGIGFIIFSFILLFINHGIRKEGMWLVLFTAVNGVATISLFKYNITHFNSVEAEQSIILFVLIIYFLIMAFFVAKENPIKFLKKPPFLLQSLTRGISEVLMSFAYLFAPASIITTGKRSFVVLWAILSGNIYFHEKRFLIKLISFLLVVIGIVFLVL